MKGIIIKTKLLTDKKIAIKMNHIYRSRTTAERAQDELLDVLGFLVTMRDGHRHKLDIGGAIAKTNRAIKAVGLVL